MRAPDSRPDPTAPGFVWTGRRRQPLAPRVVAALMLAMAAATAAICVIPSEKPSAAVAGLRGTQR